MEPACFLTAIAYRVHPLDSNNRNVFGVQRIEYSGIPLLDVFLVYDEMSKKSKSLGAKQGISAQPGQPSCGRPQATAV